MSALKNELQHVYQKKKKSTFNPAEQTESYINIALKYAIKEQKKQ